MGIDFLYKNKSLLDIDYKLKYKNYKTILVFGKIRSNNSIILFNKKPKYSISTLLNIKKEGASLKSFLYFSYYESLYLHLYNWVSYQPSLSIFSEYRVKIISNGWGSRRNYKFYGLNHREYIIHYRLFEKLSIINQI
jgi:hypothetical protein